MEQEFITITKERYDQLLVKAENFKTNCIMIGHSPWGHSSVIMSNDETVAMLGKQLADLREDWENSRKEVDKLRNKLNNIPKCIQKLFNYEKF